MALRCKFKAAYYVRGSVRRVCGTSSVHASGVASKFKARLLRARFRAWRFGMSNALAVPLFAKTVCE